MKKIRCCEYGPALHKTVLERPASDKHSSLLGTFINYGRKKFYNIDEQAENYKKTLQILLGVIMLLTLTLFYVRLKDA